MFLYDTINKLNVLFFKYSYNIPLILILNNLYELLKEKKYACLYEENRDLSKDR